jgi:hypothetical protein
MTRTGAHFTSHAADGGAYARSFYRWTWRFS